MCSIAGSIGRKIDITPNFREIMDTRGPDDFCSLDGENFTILHSRLAVIGAANPASKQPIARDGCHLVCNGFISNYKELASIDGIGSLGSDCLAVLDVYKKFGVSGFSLLRGQFAAAILDSAGERFILARDVSGITPLYYIQLDGRMLFSSQASWLRLLSDESGSVWSIGLNKDSREEWSSYGYVSGPHTLLEGIREVPPGGVVQFDMDGNLIEAAEMPLPSPNQLDTMPTEKLVRDLLQLAVRRNLNADSPPCLLFSGGLDSTLLLHCMASEGIRPQLIALKYPDDENRVELSHAAKVARYYGCRLEVVNFDSCLVSDMETLFDRRIDWPLDGGSLLPKVVLANHLASRDCKVVLGGSGADELFGGYRRHQARLAMYRDATIGDIPAERDYFQTWIGKVGASTRAFDVYLRAKSNDLYQDPAFVYDLMELTQFHNPRLDSCFANVGLEYRPVFQDQDIVSLAASLRLDAKSEIGTPKKLLRDAFSKEIPTQFIDVPKSPLRFGKMGPTSSWRKVVYKSWAASRNVETI